MIRKFAIGLFAAGVLGFGGLTFGLYACQRDLIYPVPEADGDVPDGFTPVTYRTADGLDLAAGYRPADAGMPTLLFFHGNAVDWQSTFHTTNLLAARGYGVLAAEYRGYGGNPGQPSEQGLYADGRAALSFLEGQGIAPEDIVLVGNSLGSGVATELAGEITPRALILIAAFKSMTATAENRYPYVPVDALLQDRFENIAKIARVAAPVLVIHGDADRLIPVDHARELAAAHPGARLVVLPGLGHGLSGNLASQVPQLEFLSELRSR